MLKINNNDEIMSLIKANEISIIYFTGSTCGACEAIKGKIEDIVDSFPKIACREINGEEHIALAAAYNVFSLPIMILFINEKEFLRVGRNVNLLELKENIERYYNMIF